MWIDANICKPRQNEIDLLSERVVVTVLNTRTGATFTDLDCYHHGKGRWQRWESLGNFIAYKVTHWMPIPPPAEEQAKKKRNPYKWGATSYLSSFDLGEIRQYEGNYRQYRNLQAIACRLKEDYGCVWEFRKTGDLMTIKRTQ
jgi:hypothetical protein